MVLRGRASRARAPLLRNLTSASLRYIAKDVHKSMRHMRCITTGEARSKSITFTTVEPRLTTTSLIRPPRYYDHFFLSRRNAHTFPHKKTPLMRPPR